MTQSQPWFGDAQDPDDELHSDPDEPQEPVSDEQEASEAQAECERPGEWITGWDPDAHPEPME